MSNIICSFPIKSLNSFSIFHLFPVALLFLLFQTIQRPESKTHASMFYTTKTVKRSVDTSSGPSTFSVPFSVFQSGRKIKEQQKMFSRIHNNLLFRSLQHVTHLLFPAIKFSPRFFSAILFTITLHSTLIHYLSIWSLSFF